MGLVHAERRTASAIYGLKHPRQDETALSPRSKNKGPYRERQSPQVIANGVR